ncbi:MAG: type I restriction endonuclease subunit R [Symploca sp. SIO2C1]|nr:type I restriction endonuclease subunit R [Symploca sp. SIO2C1]
MVETAQAKDISLEELQEHFGLKLAKNPGFFTEWIEKLPSLTNEEKYALDRVKSNYFNLVNRRPLLEESVKMVILSPLLDLAGFYQAPFSIKTETSIEIAAEDEGLIIRGKIDVLVLHNRLWILVIESKSTKFDVMEALPQALAYMLTHTQTDKPIFGFLVNGREFVFVKLQRTATPLYNRSYALSIERDNELYQVLAVLKHIGQLIEKEH